MLFIPEFIALLFPPLHKRAKTKLKRNNLMTKTEDRVSLSRKHFIKVLKLSILPHQRLLIWINVFIFWRVSFKPFVNSYIRLTFAWSLWSCTKEDAFLTGNMFCLLEKSIRISAVIKFTPTHYDTFRMRGMFVFCQRTIDLWANRMRSSQVVNLMLRPCWNDLIAEDKNTSGALIQSNCQESVVPNAENK